MKSYTLPVIILTAGLVLAGALIGSGFRASRSGDRFVTVKGVSERQVEADLALWPLQIVAGDNDLATAQARMDRMVEDTRTFLRDNGVPDEQVTIQSFRVTDAQAERYGGGQAPTRFIISQTLLVRSEEPQLLRAVGQRVGELVQSGVVLTSGQEYGPGGPTFLFTRLNDLKPEMLAEATARAREAAEEFATASGSQVGKIRRANQGVFEILPRDPGPGQQEQNQLHKTVRVVTTVEYLLEG
ncbi:MAG: SIMPL domain-containing protein [Longimicrobiales bacterium]|nr:SIMPL domain-containing protein [Longimicrobiales bacterium]